MMRLPAAPQSEPDVPAPRADTVPPEAAPHPHAAR